MGIVEDSYYNHATYGRVRVVNVTDGIVAFELLEKVVRHANQKFFAGKKQTAAEFREDTSPANINITADAAVFDITGKNAKQ